ncbi:hypothetical protein ACWCOV_28060 [Kribbella sp. NPDC002412]
MVEADPCRQLPPARRAALVGQPSLIFQAQVRHLLSSNTLHDSYTVVDLARLVEIKLRVDPSGVLVGNYPLP